MVTVTLFTYQPVGISVKVNNVFENFPTTFVLTERRSNVGLGRPRGKSFSTGNKTVVNNTSPIMFPGKLVNPPPGH